MLLRPELPNRTPQTMKSINRRSFLAATAAVGATVTAAPVLAAALAPVAASARKSAPAPQVAPRSGGVDVVIVGAGAAGIAAARRLAAAGGRFALLEATETVGGRCITDTAQYGVPF